MRFFYFFNTSPARIKKINRIASRSHHGLDESERKARKANRHQNFAYPCRLRLGRVFRIVKNVITQSRIACIPRGISRIPSSALICPPHEFHQNRSNPSKKIRNFNDSHSALFVQHCIDIIFDKLARSSGRFQFTMLSRRTIKPNGQTFAWPTWIQNVAPSRSRAGKLGPSDMGLSDSDVTWPTEIQNVVSSCNRAGWLGLG